MAKRGVWFRFNLRTLLLAMTIVCVVLGWALADAIRQNRIESDARRVVAKLAGTIVERGWSTAPEDQPGWLARSLGLQRGLRSLWLVRLSGSHPTSDDLQTISACRWLRSLDLSNTSVGDAELAIIAQSARLVELQLANTRVTDKGLQALKSQDALAILDVQGSNVTYDGLAQLDRSLGTTEFESVAAVQHRPFPGIHMPRAITNVRSAQPELDMGLYLLKPVIEDRLFINNSRQFDPASWQHLVHIRALRDVWAGFGKLRYPGFDNLSQLKSLESVTVDGGLLTDADLTALATLPKLKFIKLAGVNELTDDAPLQLGNNNSITQLELAGPHITIGLVGRLQGLRVLETLTLNVWEKGADGKYGPLSAQDAALGAAALAQVKDLPTLRTLHLSGNAIDDEVFLALKDAKQLKLVTWDKRFVSEDAVRNLRTHLPNCGL